MSLLSHLAITVDRFIAIAKPFPLPQSLEYPPRGHPERHHQRRTHASLHPRPPIVEGLYRGVGALYDDRHLSLPVPSLHHHTHLPRSHSGQGRALRHHISRVAAAAGDVSWDGRGGGRQYDTAQEIGTQD